MNQRFYLLKIQLLDIEPAIWRRFVVRSSAAEYLTFVAASGKGGVEAVYADENIWLTQKMMGVLYDVETHTINYHLKKVFADSELEEDSVIRNFRITAADGKNYNTKHYNLSAIIAVGYKVNSERAVQFRKWATTIIQEFTIKGYTMDDERLKNRDFQAWNRRTSILNSNQPNEADEPLIWGYPGRRVLVTTPTAIFYPDRDG